MFTGFRVTFDDAFIDEIEEYKEAGEEIFEDHEETWHNAINDYVNAGGILDASKLMNDWFPKVKADIFLSHSHDDKEMLLCFAGWLNKEFGIKAFIDSTVWGYSDNLLQQMDNRYSHPEKNGTTYDYKSCIRTSANVHLMLSIALEHMIDSTECFMCIDTEKSIRKRINAEGKEEVKTGSPWIYDELRAYKIIRQQPLYIYRKQQMQFINEAADDMRVEYDVTDEFNDLHELDSYGLLEWESHRKNKYAYWNMDKLYDLNGIDYQNQEL